MFIWRGSTGCSATVAVSLPIITSETRSTTSKAKCTERAYHARKKIRKNKKSARHGAPSIPTGYNCQWRYGAAYSVNPSRTALMSWRADCLQQESYICCMYSALGKRVDERRFTHLRLPGAVQADVHGDRRLIRSSVT